MIRYRVEGEARDKVARKVYNYAKRWRKQLPTPGAGLMKSVQHVEAARAVRLKFEQLVMRHGEEVRDG